MVPEWVTNHIRDKRKNTVWQEADLPYTLLHFLDTSWTDEVGLVE